MGRRVSGLAWQQVMHLAAGDDTLQREEVCCVCCGLWDNMQQVHVAADDGHPAGGATWLTAEVVGACSESSGQ